ncbi:uncharacterized protein LOC133920676 [Phragmites australis]|uniref:uncharacterized protein LOC133920676 n=1 Tax=Phragmites australis TaxID=29695 RepID=UPI002D7813B2|nr:uncharacterized protein LOC133920676 [Phragmites australis]
MASTRARTLAALLACVLLVRFAEGSAAPAPAGSSVFGCNPVTDKTCRPEGLGEDGASGVKLPTVPGSGVDVDGDGEEDELPSFDTHLSILGHGH